MTVKSVVGGTNGHLLAEVAKLWIKDSDHVLDCTYGRGNFWTEYRPAHFASSDIDPRGGAMYCDDFRAMTWDTDTFDVVVFDPPYVVKGGRDTSGIEDMDDRYGMRDAPLTPSGLRGLQTNGLIECVRVLKPGGILLYKTGDYISSGQYESGLAHAVFVAAVLNLEQVDLFIFLGGTGPQPSGRRQVHSRRAHTYMLCYRKPRPKMKGLRSPRHSVTVDPHNESEQQ